MTNTYDTTSHDIQLRAEAERLGDPSTEICGDCGEKYQTEGSDRTDYVKCDYCRKPLCDNCVLYLDDHTRYCSEHVED